MDGRDGLQLLPGTKKRLGIKVPGENRFLYIGSAILGATLVTMFALGRYQTTLKSQAKQVNDQIVALEQRRNRKDEVELRLVKDRLAITSGLIKGHVYWTQAFSWLENILQSQVQLTGLSIENDKKLTYSAVAGNYTIVARQIAALLSDDKVKDLNIGKIESLNNGTVKFSMELVLDFPSIILKK